MARLLKGEEKGVPLVRVEEVGEVPEERCGGDGDEAIVVRGQLTCA